MDSINQFFTETGKFQQQDNWSGFLGIGDGKKSALAQNQYEADFINRYSFSEDCTEQKSIIARLLQESAVTLQQRNSAKKNSNNRNNLTGKLRALDEYIPLAQDFLKTYSCAEKSNPVPPSGLKPVDPNLYTAVVRNPAGTPAATSLLPDANKNRLKYILIGLGAFVFVGGVVMLARRKK